MSMRFPYRPARLPRPAVTLGGALFRLRPVLDLTVVGPGGTTVIRAVLDTGPDEVLLPEAEAVRLGIDLTDAPASVMAGVGSTPHPVRYADVRLRLTDGVEYRDWPALVGFSPALASRALLGYAGCLQFFTATFSGDLAQVELAVNPTYPGT